MEFKFSGLYNDSSTMRAGYKKLSLAEKHAGQFFYRKRTLTIEQDASRL
jgi:hypothetical protein